MSRIGNTPIKIPQGVEVSISKGNLVSVKGPKGELKQQIDPSMQIQIEGDTIYVKRPTESKRHKSLHGLSRTLIANMVEGVSRGFVKKLEVIGVGYKASNTGQNLELSLGYSHEIVFIVPDEVKVTTQTEKGKAPLIILESHDKELLGMVAAKIRDLRKPEPYKGKGIRYVGEEIRRKAGKTAAG